MKCHDAIEGKASCHGDSGGPLFFYNEASDKHIQIGVTSWGEGDCGKLNVSRPAVWTKVSNYAFWIKQLIRDCGTKPNLGLEPDKSGVFLKQVVSNVWFSNET